MKKILIVIAVILVVLLIVSWKFATSFMAEKLQTADKKIAQKTEKRDELVDANNRRDQIEKDCRTMQDDNEKILGQYPEHTSVEKVLEHICNLFKQYTFGIGQMSYAEEGVFRRNDSYIQEEVHRGGAALKDLFKTRPRQGNIHTRMS